jgi:hypothetical protein
MTKYTPDREGIGEMLKSAEMQAHMRGRAEKIAAAAEAMSPVGPPGDPHIGNYASSWEVSSGVRHWPSGRAYGRVENTADYAAKIEYGDKTGRGHREGQHVLGKSIDAARD